MANVPLSATVQKLSKDFALEGGHFRMPPKKMKAWREELQKLDAPTKSRTAKELIALALKFEREGGKTAAEGAAQLYVFASQLMHEARGTRPAASAPKARGWGPK